MKPPSHNIGIGTLECLLKSRAASSRPCRSLVFYPPGNNTTSTTISYGQLLALATANARAIRAIAPFQEHRPVLLHLDDHWDTILWFWSVLLAKGLPVLSTPFSNAAEHRRKHIEGLSELLESPLCITRAHNVLLFDGADHGLEILTTEQLEQRVGGRECASHQYHADQDGISTEPRAIGVSQTDPDSLAMLMLTSGSTGSAKAVCLTHGMVLASVAGKSGACRRLPSGRPFLNWIGLDHVGALVEIHLHALWEDVDQIHVSTADVVSSPLVFLDLLSRHRVSRSFAPNFFLASLVSAAEADVSEKQIGLEEQQPEPSHWHNDYWDLSDLAFLVSGGEANDMQTCVRVSALLEKYGARRGVLAPGFGMTETCAGSIYNTSCPNYDLRQGYTVASLGTCIEGMEMRIQVNSSSSTEFDDDTFGQGDGELGRRSALPDEPGDLEIRGTMVFGSYYRNEAATKQAFTDDGWFRTGDRALIDSNGRLCLAGRVKELVNINGVKTAIADIQLVLEQAVQGRGLVSRLVVFPSSAAHTEQVTAAYIPAAARTERDGSSVRKEEVETVKDIDRILTQACLLATVSRPLIFALGTESLHLLPTTTLGKVSRAKMRSLFEKGLFAADVARYRAVVSSANGSKKRKQCRSNGILTDMEAGILQDFVNARTSTGSNATGWDIDIDMNIDAPVWELGFTSMDLIRLKHAIDKRFNISLPVITLMKNPTARSLAIALHDMMSNGNMQQQQQQQQQHNGVNTTTPPTTTTLSTVYTSNLPNYDPVIIFRPPPPPPPPPMQSNSNGVPSSSSASSPPPPPALWLIHPGVGEVLVFIPLIQRLSALESQTNPQQPQRAIYALRAPGFDSHSTTTTSSSSTDPSSLAKFTCISQAVSLYVSAIRHHQPRGPYCLAGYSYGSMLAFEVAKVLEQDTDTAEEGGEGVKFLGVLNLPPRIKERMRHLNWNRCLVNLVYFLGLVASEEAVEGLDGLLNVASTTTVNGNENGHVISGGGGGGSGSGSGLSKTEALQVVLGSMAERGRARLRELGLNGTDLVRWADVAYGLQSIAVDYEPTVGRIAGGMDVFHAVPLRAVAETREAWLRDHLMVWKEFVVSTDSGSPPGSEEGDGSGVGGGGGDGDVRFHAVGGAHYTMIGPEFVDGFVEVFVRAMRERGV